MKPKFLVPVLLLIFLLTGCAKYELVTDAETVSTASAPETAVEAFASVPEASVIAPETVQSTEAAAPETVPEPPFPCVNAAVCELTSDSASSDEVLTALSQDAIAECISAKLNAAIFVYRDASGTEFARGTWAKDGDLTLSTGDAGDYSAHRLAITRPTVESVSETDSETSAESSASASSATESEPEPAAETSEPAVNAGGDTKVYVSVSGSKYHSDPGCSGMKKPVETTLDEAVSKGYEPCKRCWKTE